MKGLIEEREPSIMAECQETKCSTTEAKVVSPQSSNLTNSEGPTQDPSGTIAHKQSCEVNDAPNIETKDNVVEYPNMDESATNDQQYISEGDTTLQHDSEQCSELETTNINEDHSYGQQQVYMLHGMGEESEYCIPPHGLTVAPHCGHIGYGDMPQNGHLSPSEDSGIGMSDHGSQASQSPNQSFSVHSHVTTPVAVSQTQLGSNMQPPLPGHLHMVPGVMHQPDCIFSPSSRGESPLEPSLSPQPQSQQQQQQQHRVYVVVHEGETFNPVIGNQIHHVQGPATVTMVSPNHPLPMPMRVNLGHTVQQYVDENGTLTHVVMSLADPDAPPQLHHHHLHHGPMQGLPPGTQAPAITVQNGGLMFGHCYPQYPPFHGGPYPPHSQSHHGPHGPMGPHYHGPPPHQHIYSEGPHGGRTKERLRHKLHQQQHDKMAADESAGARYYHGPGETNSQRRPKKRVNGEVRRSGVAHDNGHSSSSGTEANDMDEEERRKINDMLSSLQQPKVSEVCARSTRITVTPVLDEVAETELNGTVSYQLYLQDKVREKAFRDVYTGVNTDVILRDLKPATEYIIKVRSQYRDHTEHLIGQESEQAAFKTLPCEPDTPPQPTMSKRTKTALTLKWNATCDNGAKLESYVLECDQAIGSTSEGSALSSPTSENCPPTATPTAGQFKPVYSGLDRQYKLTKLQPATQYTFRLAAVNTHGQSDFCTPVVFTTNGSAPSQPDPPQLAASDVTSLTVMWLRRQGDDTFLLQMDDEHTGHGFMPVYNGADVRYRVTNLRRNTEYKFRLEAVSEEGSSKPSEAVAFLTQPDRPQPPCRLQLKGKAHSNTFKLSWDPPRDNGGMEVSLYRLELDAGRGFERRYEGPDFECLCDQLIPGQSYRARVCAYNGTKYSEFSEEVIVETLPVVPGPCVAPKLQGKARATMLHLRWVPPVYDGGARPTAYEVLMSQSDSTTRLVYSGAGMDCAVASLLPGRPYLFQVRAGNCVGPGPWSECLEVLSGAGVPDAPRAPSVTCRGSHSALVAWEEPLNNGAAVSDYRLEWQGGNLTDFTQLYQGPALSYEARGLEPASCYSFRVQAVNSAGAGAYSTPAQIQTSAAPPGPVPGLRASATAESIHVTWKEAQSHGSEVLNYNIDIGESHVIQAPGGALEYSIGKLVPETQYRVRIQAVNSLGAGPFSASRSVTTLALPPSPPVVECVSAAPNSLKLRWGDGRNPEQLHYCLEIRRNNSFIPYYQGPLQLKKVDRLQETTDYVFRINASNKAGDGPCSEHFTFRTSKAPPPAVKEPQVSEVTRDSCMVTWSAVKGQGHDKVEYTLQLQLCRGSNNVYKEVYRGESTSHRLHNLLDHTDYLVRVCAHRVSLPTPRPSPRPAVTRIAKIEANTPACEVTAKGDSEELNVARPPQYVGDAEEVGHSVEEGRAEEVEHGKEGVKASNGSVVTNSNNYATNTAASDVSDAQGNVGSENHVFSPSAILIPIAVAKALIESEDNAKALNIEAAPVILTGAFSPGRKFTTKRNEVATHSGGTSSAVATRSGGLTGWFRRSHKLAFAKTGNASGEHTKLTDKQWAAIFLIVFTFLSIFLAYMAQHLIGANHSSAPSSTGGAHGQGHSGVTGNPAP